MANDFRWTINNMLRGDTEPGHFPEDCEESADPTESPDYVTHENRFDPPVSDEVTF